MQKLHPKVVWLFFIGYLLRLSIIPVALILYLLSTVPLGDQINSASYSTLIVLAALNIIVIFWFLPSYIMARLSRNSYSYTFTENSFQKRSGAFLFRKTTILYETIKHVDIRQGILSAALGLVEIRIETWGKAHNRAEGRLPGLTKEVAEKLENELVDRAHGTRLQKD